MVRPDPSMIGQRDGSRGVTSEWEQPIIRRCLLSAGIQNSPRARSPVIGNQAGSIPSQSTDPMSSLRVFVIDECRLTSATGKSHLALLFYNRVES